MRVKRDGIMRADRLMSEDTERIMLEMVSRGETNKTIAYRLGCDPSIVAYWRQTLNVNKIVWKHEKE